MRPGFHSHRCTLLWTDFTTSEGTTRCNLHLLSYTVATLSQEELAALLAQAGASFSDLGYGMRPAVVDTRG